MSSGCETLKSLDGQSIDNKPSSKTAYEKCGQPRTLERDLSLNGIYQGVDQLYIRWDKKKCKLS